MAVCPLTRKGHKKTSTHAREYRRGIVTVWVMEMVMVLALAWD